MTSKNQYTALGHLAFLSFAGGFFLLQHISFLSIFLHWTIADISLLIVLFIASFNLSSRYLNANRTLEFILTIVFLGSVVLVIPIQNLVLPYPDILILLIYALTAIVAYVIVTHLMSYDLQNAKYLYLLAAAFFALGGWFSFKNIGFNWISILAVLDILLLYRLHKEISFLPRVLAGVALLLSLGFSLLSHSSMKSYQSQTLFEDRVVFSLETPFQKIDVTSWKGNHWFYFNGINHYNTIDEWLYYEPMVHPLLQLTKKAKNTLVIGGENGIIARELEKYQEIETIDILPVDPDFLRLCKSNPLFTQVNNNSLLDKRVQELDSDPFNHLQLSKNHYDVIIVDVPDPVDLEVNQYYTKEFYELCKEALRSTGSLITQSGSPYYATKAFYAIENTIKSAGFGTVPIHNQVMTLGEWGWVIASKSLKSQQLIRACQILDFDSIETRWINNEAMNMMLSFGKPYLITDSIHVNSIKNPVIHNYYTAGTWNF